MSRHLLATLGVAAALAIGVAACGGATTPSPAASSPAPASAAPAGGSPAAAGDAITIAGFAFNPASLDVKTGATVTWTNNDTATHSVVWDDGTTGSARLTPGGPSYTRTFDAPGTFTYHCGIHASMKGTIVVGP